MIRSSGNRLCTSCDARALYNAGSKTKQFLILLLVHLQNMFLNEESAVVEWLASGI